MDSEGTTALWLDIVENKMGELCEADKTLVKALVHNVLDRWSLKAADASEGEPTAHAMLFKTMYADNKTLAQGVIMAIVELIQTIGDGKQLPESCKGLIH